jgi:hypothetical protein
LDLMLEQLQSHQRLRILSITTNARTHPLPLLDEAILQTFSSLLCSAVPLESLELKNFNFFTREQLVLMLNAMHHCSTLVRLVLSGDWEYGAARDMAAWFRQARESSIRELCLGGQVDYNGGTAMTSLLTPLAGNLRQSSAGALLRVLELDTPLNDVQSLVEALADQRCQLRTLSLRDLNYASWQRLNHHLPDMMSLRDLTVKYVDDYFVAPNFLRALRQNGNLQTVSIGSLPGSAMLSSAELQLIQSYCSRNRWAAGMLQTLDEDGQMDREDASLLPLLLHAIKPARRMAPSTVFGGLLACNEAIGPLRRAKRIAS